MNGWDILSGVGYALDTPGALTRGVLAGRPGERVGGRELLEGWGLLGANKEGLDAGDVLGFGAELIADPMNWIGLGAIKSTARAALKAKQANRLSQRMRKMGAMPQEVAEKLHPSAIGMRDRFVAKQGMEKMAADKARELMVSDARYFGYDSQEYIDAITSMSDRDIINELGTPDTEFAHIGPGYATGRTRELSELLDMSGHGPKMFYHGTPRSGIDTMDLDPSFAGSSVDSGYYGRGVYFTPDKDVANRYASASLVGRNKTGAIARAFVDSRNPFIADRDSFSSGLKGLGAPDELLSVLERRATMTPDHSRQITDILRKSGYDSVMYGRAPHDIEELVAFDKSQIYAPFVAPRLQDVPKLSNRLAAIMAYNALARQQGGR